MLTEKPLSKISQEHQFYRL